MTLAICPKCGWYDGINHARECNELQATRAAELMRLSAPAGWMATKLGYGYGRVTFKPMEQTRGHYRMSVGFRISNKPRDRRPFELCDMFLLDDLTAREAAALVISIARWRTKMRAERKSS